MVLFVLYQALSRHFAKDWILRCVVLRRVAVRFAFGKLLIAPLDPVVLAFAYLLTYV